MICRLAELAGGALAEGKDLHLYAKGALEVLHEGHKVAVAGNERHRVKFGGEHNHVHGKPHIPIGFFCSAGENLQILSLGLNAHLGERFKKILFLTALGGNDVGQRADETAVAYRILHNVAKIHAGLVEVLRAMVKVLGVYEDSNPLVAMFDDGHYFAFDFSASFFFTCLSMYFWCVRRSATILRRPRREWLSFAFFLRCLARASIFSVRSATCTAGEPVSVS